MKNVLALTAILLFFWKIALASDYGAATYVCGETLTHKPVKNYVFELYENEPVNQDKAPAPEGSVYGRLFSRFDPSYMKEVYSGQMNLFLCTKSKESDKDGLLWFCQDRFRPIRHAQYIKIQGGDHPNAVLYDQYSSNPNLTLEVNSAPLKLNGAIGTCEKSGLKNSSAPSP